MKNIIISLLLLIPMQMFSMKIGEWKAYMTYGDISDIEPAGNMIYVLSSNNIFSYNIADNSISTYDKTRQLNDCTVTHIAWNNTVKRLIIIYENYNIDLIDNNENVINISEYSNKSMTEEKTVNNITIHGKYAYVCTAFGIIKINMLNAEISDTYKLNKNVTNCIITEKKIYANTSNGVYECLLSENSLDYSNWKPSSDEVSFKNDNDITNTNANGYNEHYVYDKYNKCYWSNQKDGKLQSYTIDSDGNKTFTRNDISPDGPKYNHFGFLKINGDKLYSCNGEMWDGGYPASIQIYDWDNDEWTTFDNTETEKVLGTKFQDVLTLDVDPTDPKHIVAGSQRGLFEFYKGRLTKHWNDENSPIYFVNGLEGNKNYEIICSTIFDKSGNLWITNSGSTKNTMLKLTAEKEWVTPSNQVKTENSANMKFMDFDGDILWMFSKYWEHPAVYAYNTVTETLTEYSHFVNEDGTAFTNVTCNAIAKDLDGNIWVGINSALLTLTKEYLNNPELGFYQYKVPRNDGTNLADYLLSGLNITAIAVDNANRKWIGTLNNGLYVIGDDNITEEQHFTKSNSGIISDNIKSIAIDNATGNVYIGTDKGLCSYQSEAAAPNEKMTKDNVWAYPNPVKPDYTGFVTIVGLSNNADVKITTSNGTLVAEGRSTAGTFQWDCTDMEGKRVASGIYMVQTATADGNKGTVCKIAIVN